MIDFFINQNCIIQALIATLFTFLVTCVGASFVFFFKKINKNVMDAMLGFSGGVMVAASFWSLLSPAIELANELKITAWLIVAIGFMSGGLLLFIGDKVFDIIVKKKLKDNKNSLKRSLMLISSITIHNIPEGLVIGVAFGSIIYNLEGVTILSSCLLALGIGLQNFPEGTAVSLPLRREGFSRLKSFTLGGLSAIVEPISGVIGAILALKIKSILPFLLAFAAGAMIYAVVVEIIPESQTNKKKNLMALFTLIGFCIMMILDVALG